MPKTIDSIVEEFRDKYVAISTQGYDNSSFIKVGANEIEVFLKSSLLSLLEEVEKELPSGVMTRQGIIKLLNKLRQ